MRGTWLTPPDTYKRQPGAHERKAILHGLWDGARGRFGENADYHRSEGEFAQANEPTRVSISLSQVHIGDEGSGEA